MSELMLSGVAPEAVRDEWLQALDDLTEQVRGWSEAEGWQVTSKSLPIEEELLGKYEAPMLVIQAPWGPLYVEPVARCVMGALGRVDMYAYPTLYRVMLLRSTKEGHPWRIR